MFKVIARLCLAALLMSASSTVLSASPGRRGAVKREIGDSRHSSVYASYSLPVTASLGSGAFSARHDYPGNIGNLYRDEYYELPGYALGYGEYEPYTVLDDLGISSSLGEELLTLDDGDEDWSSGYGDTMAFPSRFGAAYGYPYYGVSYLPMGGPSYYGWRRGRYY